MFMFDSIEKLKNEYTDKYVVVDGSHPELARFEGYTGQVKTVNMSGRALVQFDAWNNIGWYDIDPACLKIVPKPEPGAEVKKAEGKAVKETGHKPAPKAAVNKKEDVIGEKPTGGAQGAKPAGKMSTAEIIAAAKAKAGGTPAAAAKAAAPKPAAPAKATAAGGTAAGAGGAAAAPGKKLTTAEILAAARTKIAAPAAAPEPVAEAATAQPAAEPEPVATAPEAAASSGRAGYTGPAPTTTGEKIALCRQLDTK